MSRRWSAAAKAGVFPVLTLTVVVAAALSLFSLFHGVIWKPLPLPRPEQLVLVWELPPTWLEGDQTALSGYRSMQDWKGLSGLTDLAGISARPRRLDASRYPMEILCGAVTEGFFETLGSKPAAGRTLQAQDHPDGRVMVLSDELATRLFGGGAESVGEMLRVDHVAYEVVGVMPDDFRFRSNRGRADLGWKEVEAWIPLEDRARQAPRGSRSLQVIGRAKPGVGLSSIQAELATLDENLKAQSPDYYGARVAPLQKELTGAHRTSFLLLLAAALALVLIAQANLSSLTLSRTTLRQNEMAVRQAVGATPGRVFRQLWMESALVSVAGCLGGLLLTFWLLRLLTAWIPETVPRVDEIAVGGAEFLFVGLAALSTAFVLSLISYWRVEKSKLAGRLQEGRTSDPANHRSALTVLACGQLFLSFTLLHTAALLLVTLWNFEFQDPGFRRQGVQMVQAALPTDRYDTRERQSEFLRAAMERLNADPRLSPTVAVWSAPFQPWSEGSVRVEGVDAHRDSPPTAKINGVSSDFFELMGIPVLSGTLHRGPFDPEAPPQVVINQRTARLWEGVDPVGRRLNVFGKWRTVIGVVGDSRLHDLSLQPAMDVFLPVEGERGSRFWFLTRAPRSVNLAGELRSQEPQLLLGEQATLSELVADSYIESRFRAGVVSLVGLTGALLAAIGVYGLFRNLVTGRRREFAVRLALGATGGRLLRDLLQTSLLLAGPAVAGGFAAVVLLQRTLSAFLFEVEAVNLWTTCSVAGFLAALTLLATVIPARKLLRLDPASILRQP